MSRTYAPPLPVAAPVPAFADCDFWLGIPEQCVDGWIAVQKAK
jgi:hypothetical protein